MPGPLLISCRAAKNTHKGHRVYDSHRINEANTADVIQPKVTNLLRQTKSRRTNITRKENWVLLNLKKGNIIIILPAYKGNATNEQNWLQRENVEPPTETNM